MTSKEIQELKEIIKNHEKRILTLEQSIKSDHKKIIEQISIKSFFLSKKSKGAVQKTLVIAYYLEKHKGMSKFNKSDLESGFREAKEKIPDKLSDKIYKNFTNDYFMVASEMKDNQKAWNLTNKGERFVENEL